MKNSDMPANANSISSVSYAQLKNKDKLIQAKAGLTKREYAAIAAMQGIIQSDHCKTKNSLAIASYAIELADKLFDELENERT